MKSIRYTEQEKEHVINMENSMKNDKKWAQELNIIPRFENFCPELITNWKKHRKSKKSGPVINEEFEKEVFQQSVFSMATVGSKRKIK